MNELNQGKQPTAAKSTFSESFLIDTNHEIDMIFEKLENTAELHDRLRKSLINLYGDKVLPVAEHAPEDIAGKTPVNESFQTCLYELGKRISSLNIRLAALNGGLQKELNHMIEFI